MYCSKKSLKIDTHTTHFSMCRELSPGSKYNVVCIEWACEDMTHWFFFSLLQLQTYHQLCTVHVCNWNDWLNVHIAWIGWSRSCTNNAKNMESIWLFFIQIVPKKITIRLLASITFEIVNQSECALRLWNYNSLSASRRKPHPIWSSSHKEIRIFVRHVMSSFHPSFDKKETRTTQWTRNSVLLLNGLFL